MHRLKRPKVIAQRTPNLTTFSVATANNDATTEGKDSEWDTPTPEPAITTPIQAERPEPNADVENDKRLAAERLIQEQQAQAEKQAREADRQAAVVAELARKQEQEAAVQREAEAAQRREQEFAAQRQAEAARQKLAEEQQRAEQTARLAAAEAAKKQAELQAAKERAEKAAAALAQAAAQASAQAAAQGTGTATGIGSGSGSGDANNASAADAGKQSTAGRGRAENGDSASKGQAALLASPGDQTGKGSSKGKDTEQSGGGRLEQGRGAAGSGQGQPGGTSGDQRPAGKAEGNGPGVAAGGGSEGSAPGKAGGDSAPVRVAQPTVKKDAPAAIPTRAPLPDDPCRQKTDGWYKPDTQVELYAAVWRHGVSWNGDFELLQDAKEGPHQNPIVSIAIRSDGYVDKVTFIKSSGQAGIDGAIRRVIQVLSPFTPFSRELASQCDVIEFPSLWTFNQALRLTWRGQ